jgi:hypothetical protein
VSDWDAIEDANELLSSLIDWVVEYAQGRQTTSPPDPSACRHALGILWEEV